MGGVDRLRISSQSLKRAWRTSEIFEEALAGYIGTRTKLLGVKAYDTLLEKGVKEKDALEWAKLIAGQFGKCKNKDKNNKLFELEIEQLVHVSQSEQKAVNELLEKLAEENRAPEKEDLEFLRKNTQAVDISLFGRMLASSPEFNVEAAAQVSHAITVNQIVVEDDYFTAVDDLNNNEEDSGSAHIGETAFGAGVFYTYVCINKSLLFRNLEDNLELANNALRALTEAALTVAPSGKQNSYASRVRASFALAEKGTQQPRSLAVSFLDPIKETAQDKAAIARLKIQNENMDKVYGACADSRYEINALAGEGSLDEMLKFVTS
jgi:CRISPR system Cascade subunit CasC